MEFSDVILLLSRIDFVGNVVSVANKVMPKLEFFGLPTGSSET